MNYYAVKQWNCLTQEEYNINFESHRCPPGGCLGIGTFITLSKLLLVICCMFVCHRYSHDIISHAGSYITKALRTKRCICFNVLGILR